ncbi:hypothetical protein MWU54_08020 [Marivita sp. S6314]|uniref:hypothetical protein n=1 Tax=Marivita sp. S6314 TaxID=2926406 RepID=UPI001FF618AD|nr:hypothetical protein [Marivita sp. S6314]MCK0149963.1 hypothetical protein [Marivita sp. S6314]
MDVTALAFYALVCGVLGWAAPRLGVPLVRFGIGALVGIIAASILPVVRAVMGG